MSDWLNTEASPEKFKDKNKHLDLYFMENGLKGSHANEDDTCDGEDACDFVSYRLCSLSAFSTCRKLSYCWSDLHVFKCR